MTNSNLNWVDYDHQHVWHPYTNIKSPTPAFPVKNASGCTIELQTGERLIDGMASWWSAIHGYNHPRLNEAIKTQLESMAHVMFGGLTHRPAADLARKLIHLTPDYLDYVFLSDSGSVAVEVALKMALQYSNSVHGNSVRQKILTIRGGYHGDTFGAMSVCDPVTGMHSLFTSVLPKQIFVDRPKIEFDATWDESDFEQFETVLSTRRHEICAVILEPIVQGAGGMYFYHPTYLKRVRETCDRNDVLLIADEIATGFGRTGKLFACEHANITPDILCVGKSLTGGYMSLAATLCNEKVASGISSGEPGLFMHGPTFMGNPLACACANASIELLMTSNWQANVSRIEDQLSAGLETMNQQKSVKSTRVLGAIGVVELHRPIDMHSIGAQFIKQGIWVRPFGTLVYVMPPFCINNVELARLVDGIGVVVGELN
jgi:adenosylmethionine-8-amino-7-oxononanoate aminotransferase